MQPDYRMTITDQEFHQLRDLIQAHTGIALSDHKRALVCARLAKRLRRIGAERYADYYRVLTQADPEEHELMAMINAITTNKTDFFREPHHFRHLQHRVFSRQPDGKPRPRPLLIWSAGSSSGEEAYSIAMTAMESIPGCTDRDVLILATDIDTDMLERGQNGIYSLEQAGKISEPLLRKYFMKGERESAGLVMAKPSLKSLIRFRRLNLMDDAWPMQKQFDVIFCRNVIIYFDKPTQQRLFRRFAENLKKGGLLMLGHSEGLNAFNDSYRHVDHSTYQFLGMPSS